MWSRASSCGPSSPPSGGISPPPNGQFQRLRSGRRGRQSQAWACIRAGMASGVGARELARQAGVGDGNDDDRPRSRRAAQDLREGWQGVRHPRHRALHGPRGRVHLHRRPVRLRQEHVSDMLRGLHPADAGAIRVMAAPIAGPGPDRGMVFQEFALFPWRRSQNNVELGPRGARASAAQERRTSRAELSGHGRALRLRAITIRTSSRAA